MIRTLICILPLVLAGGVGVEAKEDQKLPLHVLYLARENDAVREEAIASFLEKHFVGSAVLRRSQFAPADAKDVDVVLLDWSQHEDRSSDYASPLGDLEEWSTPTVFLGSSGLLIAGPWHVIGGAG